MSVCRHELGVQQPTPRQFQPRYLILSQRYVDGRLDKLSDQLFVTEQETTNIGLFAQAVAVIVKKNNCC